MSCYDLDLWPLDLELLWSFGRHVFRLCVKFEQNRTIRCRVIDDLVSYFPGGYFQTLLLRGGWTELHQIWSVAVLERFYCLYVTLRCDLELWPRNLDLWPLSLNICGVTVVPYWNSVRNLSSIGQSVTELLQFELWPYDLEHVPCVALCSGVSLHKV